MLKNGMCQWGWTEMEELLQCPVCLDIPAVGAAEQCRHGHHICLNCRKNVDTCPLCKCEFMGTRNFVLEELVLHFDILKNTMLLNNIVTEKPKKSKKKKDTPIVDDPGTVLKSLPPRRIVRTPNSSKGTYPCRVADCDVSLPVCRLLNHARTFHSDILTESVIDFRELYTQTFEIPFKNKKPINRNSFILFISGIGLVYLNIEIMRSCQIAIYIQMAAKYTKCQEYLGSLDVYSDSHTYSWNTRLVSTRHGFAGLMNTFCCFTLNKMQIRNACENKKLKCKLRLTRYDILNQNVITRPNVEQLMIVSAIRASLVSEEDDKKLLKKLEPQRNKNANSKDCISSQDNGHVVDIHDIVAQVMQNEYSARRKLNKKKRKPNGI